MGSTSIIDTNRRSMMYLWLGLIATLVVFTGFAKSFYLQGLFFNSTLSNLLVIHGISMTIWFALFITQVGLNLKGRNDLHRRLGVSGAVFAILVVVLGIAVTIESGRKGISPASDVPVLAFMAVPFFDIAVFAGFIATALVYRRRPDIHKRLMLLATLSILTAPIARIPVSFIEQGGLPVFFGIMIALVVLAAVIDTIKHRKLHKAMAWGVAIIILSVPIRIMVAMTEPWMRSMAWLVGN
ncbi:hypothetical protein FM042_00925 [Aliidiomarina halalkaliphila]|uniref:DUF2306 domain-containing protein n=1 Tax=Aliidiomarina halalkaliphila TaxID=2593535 RepID=A0A552X3J7_9GAMM|nr:hypothetical protein [Aliidiomarina halalkaliphila]TRW49459.1 hypothetical protein FM042_00925 [Aliidiomarina halalkaliphila]